MAKGEVGFIGLGRMGFPMARNLAAAGWTVHAHDVSPDAAKRAGTVAGITVLGGDRDQLATVQPLLDVIGRLTMYVGPSGTGNRIKLLHNALGAVNAVAVAESLALAERLGVDPQTYYDVVRQGGGMAYSTYFDRRVMRDRSTSSRPCRRRTSIAA